MKKELYLHIYLTTLLYSAFLLHNLRISVLYIIWIEVFLFIPFVFVGRMIEFETWGDWEKEEQIRREMINQKNSCNYCGTSEISIHHSDIFLQYCGTACSSTAKRHFIIVIGYILALLSFLFPPAFIISLPTVLWGMFNVSNHSPEFLYRRLDTPKIKELKGRDKWRELVLPGENSEGVINSGSVNQIEDGETVRLEQLDINVKVCCFQTARLQEKYCKCGRAVPTKLLDHLSFKGA